MKKKMKKKENEEKRFWKSMWWKEKKFCEKKKMMVMIRWKGEKMKRHLEEDVVERKKRLCGENEDDYEKMKKNGKGKTIWMDDIADDVVDGEMLMAANVDAVNEVVVDNVKGLTQLKRYLGKGKGSAAPKPTRREKKKKGRGNGNGNGNGIFRKKTRMMTMKGNMKKKYLEVDVVERPKPTKK